MFIVKNPGTWHQYLRANPTLPIMEAKRRFLIEQQNYNRIIGIGRPKSGGDPIMLNSISLNSILMENGNSLITESGDLLILD
jgi:hypothetical protein